MAQVISPESKDRGHDAPDWIRLTKLKKLHEKSGVVRGGGKGEKSKQ